MPTWSFLIIQDTTTPTIEQLSFFHDHTMVILVTVTVLSLYMIGVSSISKFYNKFILEGQDLETIWTILPRLLLIFIALPSIKILYLIEENKIPSIRVKASGHQWYWSYENVDFLDNEIDVFIEESYRNRLLSCSQSVLIPHQLTTRVLVTSADVLHSWSVPRIGVKADANPGRLNQIFLSPKRLGVFFGQCSEICGRNHSFIPISIEVSFINNVINFYKKNT